MSPKRKNHTPDVDVQILVNDDTYAQLLELCGQQVAAVTVWEDSIAETMAQSDLSDTAFDMDLYLSDGVYFELYGVLCYPNLDTVPISGVGAIRHQLSVLVNGRVWLDDVAVDTEDALVLVLTRGQRPQMYLNVGAWSLGEWEQLPAQD